MPGMNPVVLTCTDTEPNVEATLVTANGPQDLTGCTVTLYLRKSGDTTSTTYAATLNADPTTGKVTVDRSLLSGLASGLYAAEWRVTFVDDTVTTFPTPRQYPQDFQFVDRRA